MTTSTPHPTSTASDDVRLRQALQDEASRLIEDCLHTGRNHHEAGRRWASVNTWLGVPTAMATTVLAGGAGISALLDQQPAITALLALSAAALSAAKGFLRPGESSEENSLKGNRFIALRNDARIFQQIDLRSGQSVDDHISRIKELRKRYSDLNEAPPLVIQRRDYLKARNSIESGESEYQVDARQKEGSNRWRQQ